MGDCPELFNRMFGGSTNLQNSGILRDWETKLYHIVQYEFRNPMVARKITGMLLAEDDHELYKAIVRDHYRFLNPALNVNAAELRLIEARVAEFYEILMAERAELLREANAGNLNLESYVVRGAAGARLRNNNVNTGVRNRPLERQPKPITNADKFKALFIEYSDLPRQIPTGMNNDDGVDELRDTAGKLHALIEFGKGKEGISAAEIAQLMLYYADVSASIWRARGAPSAKPFEELFKEAAEAAEKSGDIILHIAALNMYGGFMGSFGSKPYKEESMKIYGKAYQLVKKRVPPGDSTRAIVSLNYVNALSDFGFRIDPNKIGLADLVMTEILKTMPEDDELRERFLARQVQLKLAIADDPPTDAQLNQIIDLAAVAKDRVSNPQQIDYLKSELLKATKTLYTRILASTRKGKFKEATDLMERIKGLMHEDDEKAMLDRLIEHIKTVGNSTQATLKAKLKAATRGRG